MAEAQPPPKPEAGYQSLLPMDSAATTPDADRLAREAERRRAAMAADRFAERAEDEARQAEAQALADHERHKKERRERRCWDGCCEAGHWSFLCCF